MYKKYILYQADNRQVLTFSTLKELKAFLIQDGMINADTRLHIKTFNRNNSIYNIYKRG